MSAPVKALPRKRITTRPPEVPDDAVELEPGVYEIPDEEEGSRMEERAPKIPTPTVSEQVESIRDTARRATSRVRGLIPNRPAKKATGVKRPRSSVENLISGLWGLGARVAQAVPNGWAVGNVLALQSPVAGKILEDTVKNTVVDTVLQPFARLAQGSQVGMALLGPPVLVAIASARPDSQPFIEPLLKEALKAWLVVAGPKMIERAEEERKFQEEYGFTIELMVKQIFTPPPGMMADDNSGPVDTPAGRAA